MKRALPVVSVLALVLAGSAAARVTPAERQAINRTLDAFVNHGLKRQDTDAAWNLVTPNFRYGISRKAWDAGNLPVTPYPARGTTFHEWTIDASTPTQVQFELMVSSAKSKDDSIQFNGTMRKVGGRWLVDSFNPSATFGGGAVVGPSDFTPGPGGGTSKGVTHLHADWIGIPAIAIGAGILFLIGWFVFTWFRGRRQRRAYRRPLDPIRLTRSERSEPTLVAEKRGETDG